MDRQGTDDIAAGRGPWQPMCYVGKHVVASNPVDPAGLHKLSHGRLMDTMVSVIEASRAIHRMMGHPELAGGDEMYSKPGSAVFSQAEASRYGVTTTWHARQDEGAAKLTVVAVTFEIEGCVSVTVRRETGEEFGGRGVYLVTTSHDDKPCAAHRVATMAQAYKLAREWIMGN